MQVVAEIVGALCLAYIFCVGLVAAGRWLRRRLNSDSKVENETDASTSGDVEQHQP